MKADVMESLCDQLETVEELAVARDRSGKDIILLCQIRNVKKCNRKSVDEE